MTRLSRTAAAIRITVAGVLAVASLIGPFGAASAADPSGPNGGSERERIMSHPLVEDDMQHNQVLL